ncbi:MAG: alpha/beta hydrolase [Actinomycetota bacterium]
MDETREGVTVISTDGLHLEGLLQTPPSARAAVVFCHPHPQMGGTMNAPLLDAVCGYLHRRGWAVLRFNFRGIGASEGESSTGEAEVADARGALAEVGRRLPGLPRAIAGWSFGGAVAVRTAIVEPDVQACVGIAPAVLAKPGVTAGLPDAAEMRPDLPLLLVAGANDRQIVPDDVRAWAAAAAAAYAELPGANHLFWGKYDDLAATVTSFLESTVLERR